MKKMIFICGVLLFIFISTYLIFSTWIEESRSDTLRKQLISSIEAVKSCDGKIKLPEVLPPQYSELCFQPAYVNKSDFAKRTKKTVNGYEMLQHDGDAAWWFFEIDGSGTKLLMSRTGKGNSPDIEEGLCFLKEDTSLSFDCNANITYIKQGEK